MSRSQKEKTEAFRALHQRDRAFLLPNPYDRGTARLLAHLGFEALATTSAGAAFTAGKPDGAIGRDAALQHVKEIAAATDLPLNADLENGFGDAPEFAAETIRLAAAAGASGGSIEDATGRADRPIYEFQHAVARVRAAAEAAHSLPIPFTLTARAENFLYARAGLNDTIKRLQAFQEAGADVLYAPGIVAKEQIAEVVRSVDKPVNVLAGMPGFSLTVEELSALGVKRVSVGGAFARAALGAFLRAAREMKDRGTFTFLADAASSREINGIFSLE